MRLSNDGLTEISMYGMMDWFRDNLAEVSDEFELRTASTTLVSGGSNGDITVVVTIPAGGVAPSVGMHISGQTGGYVTNVTKSGNNLVCASGTTEQKCMSVEGNIWCEPCHMGIPFDDNVVTKKICNIPCTKGEPCPNSKKCDNTLCCDGL